MTPRHAKTRSKSPSRKRRGDHADDFDLPPSTEVPFSAPWHGAPKDEFSMTAHLWPIELFEAFYGALWKAVSKKDPKWARRFDAALMEQVMGSAGSADEIVERLAGFDYAQKAGRPKGSGDVIPSRTRSSPNRSRRPLETWKIPPISPTSSPMISTLPTTESGRTAPSGS